MKRGGINADKDETDGEKRDSSDHNFFYFPRPQTKPLAATVKIAPASVQAASSEAGYFHLSLFSVVCRSPGPLRNVYVASFVALEENFVSRCSACDVHM
ncbi:hypothetical protein CDAR_564281 [Caerostris darwini]|uniref:Uncharacterized protein n=1 Tax=Caerostris darwini TaxID=1538125 RepID=A0AAV4VLA6_9ARAC|nr:hypothetical protein CDAR_564281 [Caerostris darwini]